MRAADFINYKKIKIVLNINQVKKYVKELIGKPKTLFVQGFAPL
jgi:hypothetical protein